jgi:hypothetical protein
MQQVEPEIVMVKTDSLIPYAMNSRTHSPEQVAQIAASIREFGFTNPVLTDGENGIIAGHGRVMAAQKLGLRLVPCIELPYLTEAQRKAYIIADNKLALNAGWDFDVLKAEMTELGDLGFDMPLIGFSTKELEDILSDKKDNPYTEKVGSPSYEPSGDKPKVSELFDDSYAMGLIEDIKNSGLPDIEKQFLMAAAARHIVFDYEKIANYYAHSESETQLLMENSALVIIDYERAIELGFVSLTEKIAEICNDDDEDCNEQ